MSSYITSNVLKRAGVKHGFSERGPDDGSQYGSLNVKSDAATPDDPQRARTNRSTILRDAGVDPDNAVFLRTLAHGNTVYEAHREDIGHEIDGYDSIMTSQPIAIGLSVADCVPILLYDPDHNAAAAVHAGWRGTQAKVVSETIRAMSQHYRTKPASLKAVIGPAICGACYEVGDEVAELFDQDLLTTTSGRRNLDLRKANEVQLKVAGVEKIDNIDLCTFEANDRFFSVRKEGHTGRFLAFIQPKK